MNYHIAVIPGDGIGPEIVAEAKKVLDKVASVYGHNFEYEELELEEKREYENYKRRCLAEADHSQEKKCLEYLTVPEAAELAGVEPATIAYWYTTGKISVRKTGKIIRIPREAFEQWLLKRKEKGVV